MKKADIDSIIDGALSHYARAEPLAGIEQRVLNRIATTDPGIRTSKILAWVLCCPILIALLAIAISAWAPTMSQPAHIDFAALPHVALPSNTFVIVRRPARHARLPIAPKPSISSDERRLLALVESHPAELQQILADMQRRNQEPVEIREIQIAPLQIPEVE